MHTAQPGDIFLVYSNGGPVGRSISATQSFFGFPADACATVHVALAVGDGDVLHATFHALDGTQSQVRRQSLVAALAGREVTQVSPFHDIDQGVRHRVVETAAELEGQTYSLRVVAYGILSASRGGALMNRLGVDTQAQLEDALNGGQICSTFIWDVYDRVFRADTPLDLGDVDVRTAPFVMPAEFYVNPRLATVDIA